MKITTQQEIQYLKKASLFQNLKPAELKIISLTMKNLIYEKDEMILHEGDEGDEAYIIYSGEVEVYKTQPEERKVFLNLLGPGEIFGELALFGEGFRSASIKAVKETLVGVITKEKLYEIIREFPDIAIEMLKIQTHRFFRAENRLMEFITDEKRKEKE